MSEINQEELQKAYYAVIPANVRYDADIPANAKLLYGEITALCNQKGYCWATNEYFANLYGCSKRSISEWIAKLKEKGYIGVNIIYKDGTKEIQNRYIKIVDSPIEKNFHTYGKNLQYPIEEIFYTPIEKNFHDNNTLSFNTTKNKKKERKTCYDDILSSVENEELRELYIEYIKMRKMIKSPMTDRALTMLINKVKDLEPSSIERQKKVLETAIVNNWKSVYPLKEQEKHNSYDGEDFFNAAVNRSKKN